MKDFASLDRIKYRRWWAVYIADMRHLQSSNDPEDKKVCDAFMAGDFSCQTTDIPGTQESRRIVQLRTVGVLKVSLPMKTAGQDTFLLPQFFVRYLKRCLPKQHHQHEGFISFQSMLSFSETEVPFQNMITGQIFPNEITESLESFEQVGSEMYKEFVT